MNVIPSPPASSIPSALSRSWLRTALSPLVTLSAIILLGTCLGYAISQVGRIPGWELLMICLFIPPLILLWRTSLTHPLALFPMLYLAYFLIGSQNWVERAGYTNFRTFIETNAFLRLPVIGLVAYMCGVMIVNYQILLPSTRTQPAKVPAPKTTALTHMQLRRAGVLLGIVGLIGAAAAVSRHGILLSNPEARSGGLGRTGVLAYSLIPATVLLATTARRRAASFGFIAGGSLLLLVTVGFRITVVVLVLSYLVFTALQGRMRPRSILIGVALILLIAFAVSSYRLDRSGKASVYGTEIVPTNILAQAPSLTALYYQIPREGSAVLNSLVTRVPGDYPFMHGRLQLATYETAFPHSGKKIDSRGIVTQLVYGTSTVPTTLTPSILGAPYVDFGVPGVVIEMGLIGMFLAYIYRRSRRDDSVIAKLAYAYFLAVVIAGIHTGLLDVQFEVIVPLFTAIALWLAYIFSPGRPKAKAS